MTLYQNHFSFLGMLYSMNTFFLFNPFHTTMTPLILFLTSFYLSLLVMFLITQLTILAVHLLILLSLHHPILTCNLNPVNHSSLEEPLGSPSHLLTSEIFIAISWKNPLYSQTLLPLILCKNICPIKHFLLHTVIIC